MDDQGNDLTAEQTDSLLQFQDLTGIEDMQQCREILTNHNWDLEVAVHHRLSEEDGDPSPFEQQHQEEREPRTPQMDINPVDQRIYTAMAPRQHYPFYHWPFLIFLMPIRMVYRTISSIFNFTYRLIFTDPRTRVVDPQGDVMSFFTNFEAKYGTEHPRFYQGSYSKALNEAKADLRFMVVYLHSEDFRDTEQFCRTTLCNSEVISYLNENMILWACDINTPEGYRVSRIIRETIYPLMALIVLRDTRMTVVARIEGHIDPEQLILRLSRSIRDNEASLVAARVDREERSFNQTLRQEQDHAYLQSLKADQEKERKKREEEEAKERERKRIEEEKLAEEQRLEDLEQLKERLRDSLPTEPDNGDPNAVKILLKLPSGARLERSFYKTDSLKHLYSYVLVHEAAPDDFQIVTNFPRKVLPCKPDTDGDSSADPPTFEEVGLGKSELLFVHDNEA